MSTREKIIKEAKKHFNQHGFSAVTLYELAQKIGMSRGNLAYHFKDKEELLEVIVKEMWARIETERSKSRQFPSFENIHNEVQLYYKVQKEYSFIFLDPHLLNHPLIRNQFRSITRQSIADYRAAIAFSIKMGNMKPESVPGTYYNIAFITWMLTFYWLSQQIIRGEKTNEDGEKLIWSILIPHFTEKGEQSFKNFFGKEYFANLGEPFDVDFSNIISF